MMSSSKSFPKRLSLNIVFLTSILFIVATIVAAVSSHLLIAEEACKSAENLRDASILRIEKILQGVESSVHDVVWLADENKIDTEYLYHITYKLVEENPNIIGSAIAFIPNYVEGQYYFSPYSWFDENEGRIRQRQLGNPDYDYFYMDWFQIPYIKGEPSWSEPYYDEGGGECLMSTYSFPIRDADGNITAIITADITLQWIAEILEEIHPYASSTVALVSRAGKYINFDDNFLFKGETVFSAEEYYSKHDYRRHDVSVALMRDERGLKEYTHGSQVSFAAYGPLSNGWKMVIACDYKDVLSRASTMHIVLILLCLVGVIILFLLCYFAIRKLTRPLVGIAEAAVEIGQGKFNTPLPAVKYDDEIRTLRNSMVYMEKSINDYIENLKKTTADKERIESELNIASSIQMSMLPSNLPDNERISIHAMLKPAKEVGGDMYDIVTRDNSIFFMVGDVSGKGVPASLYMALTISAFRFISGLGLTLGQMASKINNTFCETNSTDSFVTLFFGVLHMDSGELVYVNCGHNPMVAISPDGKPSFIKAKPNLAVGVFPDFEYHAEKLHLEHGSELVLFTDGVTEAETADKQLYGEQRLMAICEGGVECSEIYDDIKSFTDGNAQNDDITIMTIKYR